MGGERDISGRTKIEFQLKVRTSDIDIGHNDVYTK